MFRMPKAVDALPDQRGIKYYFLVQRFCFKAIGMDPTSLEETIFNRFFAWIPMLAMLTLLVPIGILASQYTDDLDKMANTISPMWQCVLSIAKFTLFMWNKKKIVGMVRTVWFSNLNVSDAELKILVEENHFDRLISLSYYLSALISSILLICLPFMIAGFFAWKGHSYWESLEVPYPAVYYWDTHSSIYAFGGTLIWNCCGTYYVLHGSLGVDTLFSWFMRNISAQFRILNLRFKVAADAASDRIAQGNGYSDEEFAQSIIVCVKHHIHCLELASSFNEVYQQLVFVKFLISCVQIACLTFQFSRGGDIVVQVFNVSFMITVAIQLMLYCHGGQKIMDLVEACELIKFKIWFNILEFQSLSVGSNIYKSFHWHELSVKSQKLLLLPMMRSEISCKVTGVFFVADLTLFLWVYRTAGSFLTFMLTMDENAS